MSGNSNGWRKKLNEDIVIELQKDNRDFEKIFFDSALDLMKNYALKVGDKTYDFIELEFYFKLKDEHPDLYTHGTDEQKDDDRVFYVHKKNGNRAGVDLVFGTSAGDIKYFGGILIRGIRRENCSTYGPAKSIKRIYQGQNMKHEQGQEFFDNKIVIINNQEKDISKKDVLRSVRHGLKFKENKKPYYILKLYRFIRNNLPSSPKPEGTLQQITMAKDIAELHDNKDQFMAKMKKIETNIKEGDKIVLGYYEKA